MSIFSKKIKWYWLIPTVLITAVITVMATFIPLTVHYRAKISEAYRAADLDTQTYAYVKELFETYYIGDLGTFDEDSATDSLIAAYVASTGDRYARYMNAEAYKEYLADYSGNFVGIGVQVVYDEVTPAIEIIMPMPDSPAEKEGLQAGDRIIAVGDLTVAADGYSATADAIKGEEGTSVTVTVKRGEETFDLTLVRATVKSLSVTGKMLSDGKTAFVRITGFDETTPVQFAQTVEALEATGAASFVFDLRGNPGGELESVLSVLDYILPKDSTLIRITDAGGEVTTRAATDDHTFDYPMAILINDSTASAAELFTSCLRDYDKAQVVGTTSFGKGCMQRLFPLPNGGGVTITFRMYSPPVGENYDGVGITPDLTVELSGEAATTHLLKLTEENDDQLRAAMKLLADN